MARKADKGMDPSLTRISGGTGPRSGKVSGSKSMGPMGVGQGSKIDKKLPKGVRK